MLRYIFVMVLIGLAFSDAYKTKNHRRRQYYKPQPDYADGDYDDYMFPVYAKDSEAGNERPSIFTYWNNFLKRTRLPSWNITNPFSKLFTPYVIKVDFPEVNVEPQSQPNRNKKPKPSQHEDVIYLNTYPNNDEPDNAQFFYDPVTQQYYEVQESASEDYNPQNNYYATTFNDQDEIVIDLSNKNHDQEKDSADDDEEEQGKVKKATVMGKYNSPVIRKLKTKRFKVERRAATEYDYQ